MQRMSLIALVYCSFYGMQTFNCINFDLVRPPALSEYAGNQI